MRTPSVRFGRVHEQWSSAAARVLLAGLCLAGSAAAQNLYYGTLDELNRAGFGLYSISAFSVFNNATTPYLNPTTQIIQPNFNFQSYSSGLSASLGWRARKAANSQLFIRFTPSYYYLNSSTGLSRSQFIPNQALTVNWSRAIGSKWHIGAALSATVADYNQMLLVQNGAQGLAGLPSTSGQFVPGLLSGATGSTAILAAQQNYFYGGYFINATASVTASYAVTERLTITGTASGNRIQHLNIGNNGTAIPYVIPKTTGLSGAMTLSYRLSERTNLFGSVNYTTARSALAVTPSAAFSVGANRRVTDHFFVNFDVGAGYLLPRGVGSGSAGFQREQWQASGSLGYRLYRQSFVFNASRSVSDPYGVIASATVWLTGGWSWHPGQSAWSLTLGGSDIRLEGSQFGRNGYSLNAGLSRFLGDRRFSMSLSAGYGSYSVGQITVAGVPSALSQPLQLNSESVRLSLNWHPYLGQPDPDPIGPDTN